MATAHVNGIATAVPPGGKDLFFHQSAVEGARFEDLQQGQRISLTEGGAEGGARHAALTMAMALACQVCGHPVVAAKNHDVPALRAAKMFEAFTCKCGKPARVRCFNGVGTYWVECEDGHGVGRPA